MRAAAMAIGLMAACQGPGDFGEVDLYRLPGGMASVEESNPAPSGRFELQLMATREDCQRLKNSGVLESIEDCTPIVETGNGSVRLAYRVLDGGTPLPLPVQADAEGRIDPSLYVGVSHGGDDVRNQAAEGGAGGEQHLALIPHGETTEAAQLFVLLIDRSQSMNALDSEGRSRMDRVKRALLTRSVVDRFFYNSKNRVLILTFAQDVQAEGSRDGKALLVDNKDQYAQLISGLRANGTRTELYRSISHATSHTLKEADVRAYLKEESALPTVIALTDGFDFQGSEDTCGSNAKGLARLLKTLDRQRRQKSSEVLTPVVYTVGLGQPALADFPYLDTSIPDAQRDLERNKLFASRPQPDTLCGSQADALIDPPRGSGLEDAGIDNASLEWIAARGGGSAVITTDLRNLVAAFEGAAAKRYEWFEVRYQTDPTDFRQSFEVTLKTNAFADTRASIRFHPPVAFDLPESSLKEGQFYGERASFRSTTALMLPLLGLFISLVFLGAASFNLRRALGRESPRSSTYSE